MRFGFVIVSFAMYSGGLRLAPASINCVEGYTAIAAQKRSNVRPVTFLEQAISRRGAEIAEAEH
jgi:hypothetical protein